MDTAVHLAATPDEADFMTLLLPNNVIGLYRMLEAARHARLGRVILISSGQLYRGHDGPLPITPATPTSPRNWYALTKVLTEAAGQVYAATHGLNVVVIRPGWVPRDRAHAAELAASAHGKDGYLSPGDAGRGFAAAVEAEGLPPLHGRARLQPAGRDGPLRPSPGEDAARLRAARSLARGPRPGRVRRRRPMTEMSAGRAVVELLKAEGVRHVFGIVGSTFLDVLDVLYDDKSVEYVNVRHEQGGAFMADGLARVTGAPAVCLVTSGPGATNLVTGIAGAHVAHSPVVAIAGGSALAQQGRDAFQELDLVSLFRPVTKLSVQVTQPSRIPDMLRLAFRTAMTGRKGPVFVDIPRDVLNDQVVAIDAVAPEAYRATRPVAAPPRGDPRGGAPPGAGGAPAPRRGRRRRRGPARAISSRASARVTGSRRSRRTAATTRCRIDDPLYVGPLGRAGAPEAAEACRRADLLLVVGSRLGQFTSFYDGRYIQPGTPIVQVDIDAPGHRPRLPGRGRASRPTRGRRSPRSWTRSREERVRPVAEAWQREAQALRARRQSRLSAEASLDAVPVKPQRVYAELRRALPPDTIVALDAGAAPAYGYDRLHFDQPRTFLTPLDLGGLGFAFPAALGAKLGRPEAPALAIHGDGGFLMNAQELETAVRHGIPAVALVLEQQLLGLGEGLPAALLPRALRRHGHREPPLRPVRGALRRAGLLRGAAGSDRRRRPRRARRGQPAIVEIPIDPDEFPVPATTARRRDG